MKSDGGGGSVVGQWMKSEREREAGGGIGIAAWPEFAGFAVVARGVPSDASGRLLAGVAIVDAGGVGILKYME